jgi:CheY-like chemotaxis protein
VALYHVFHTIWGSTGAQLEGRSDDAPSAAGDDPSARLLRIAPRSRQAFLLTALEGFTPSEAAQILDADFAEVERLIATAQSEIDAELATDVLIIEDEPVIATDIAALARELGHQVIGIAATQAEAIEAAARRRPGLVLADIQLADGSSGVDAVREILSRFDVPVIFITAFPERLLTGERPEPTFLITKPFLPETVKAAIGQALFFHPARDKQAA